MEHSKPVRLKTAPTSPDRSGSKPRGESVSLFFEFTIVEKVRTIEENFAARQNTGPFSNKQNPPNTPKNGKRKHMNHKQKIGYTILGAFIMLIGMSIDNLTSRPVTAQTDGEITCQKLTFVDETGKPLFYIETGKGLSIFKADVVNWDANVVEAKEVMRLTSSGLFGSELSLLNPNGKGRVRLDASQFSSFVSVFNHEGKEAVSLASTNGRESGVDINRVRIFNNEGEQAVTLEARMKNAAFYAAASPIEGAFPIKELNSVYVYNNAPTLFDIGDGRTRRRTKAAVSLVSDEDGNKVTVYNKGPKVVRQGDILNYRAHEAVRLGDTEHGGRVDVFNKQGENRAVMSVNEYGNGAVSTWDKNGYRQ